MDRQQHQGNRSEWSRAWIRRARQDELDDREALELLLALASPAGNTFAARILLERYGDLRAVLDAPAEDLRSIEGLDGAAPLVLQLVRSAATLYLEKRVYRADLCADATRLEDMWRMRIGALPNEVFEVAFLDASHRLLRDGIQRLQEGTIDRAVVYPRRVMEAALRRGAAALVLAHNHPSGQVAPSEHDKLLTRALVLAAQTLGLVILDHLVVTVDSTFSFRQAGLL